MTKYSNTTINTINSILVTRIAINDILNFIKDTAPGQHPISLDINPNLYNSIDHLYSTPGLHAWLNTIQITLLKLDSTNTITIIF